MSAARGCHRAVPTSPLARVFAALRERRARRRAAWRDLSRGGERHGYGSDVR